MQPKFTNIAVTFLVAADTAFAGVSFRGLTTNGLKPRSNSISSSRNVYAPLKRDINPFGDHNVKIPILNKRDRPYPFVRAERAPKNQNDDAITFPKEEEPKPKPKPEEAPSRPRFPLNHAINGPNLPPPPPPPSDPVLDEREQNMDKQVKSLVEMIASAQSAKGGETELGEKIATQVSRAAMDLLRSEKAVVKDIAMRTEKSDFGGNNAILTIPGRSEETLVLGAHYGQSIKKSEPPEPSNDFSGPGGVFKSLLKTLAVYADSKGSFEKTIEYHFWAQGFGRDLGAQQVFDRYQRQRRPIHGVLIFESLYPNDPQNDLVIGFIDQDLPSMNMYRNFKVNTTDILRSSATPNPQDQVKNSLIESRTQRLAKELGFKTAVLMTKKIPYFPQKSSALEQPYWSKISTAAEFGHRATMGFLRG